MNTAVLVPLSSYNSDLTHPVPYDSFIPTYERALGTTDYSQVIDRNWATDKWRIVGSVTVIGVVNGGTYADSVGSFTAVSADPAPVEFTCLFNRPAITVRGPQPNFAIQNRETIVNFGVPTKEESGSSASIFPLARTSDDFTPVGGQAIRGVAQVSVNVGPYYSLIGNTMFPFVSVSVSATIEFVRDDITFEEGGGIEVAPVGGSFPYGPTINHFAGTLNFRDYSRTPYVDWGNVILNNPNPVSSIVSLQIRCDTRFLP